MFHIFKFTLCSILGIILFRQSSKTWTSPWKERNTFAIIHLVRTQIFRKSISYACDSCDSSLGSLGDFLPSTDILQSCKALLCPLLFFIFCHLIFFYYDLDFCFLILRRIYTCILISYLFLSFYLLSFTFVSSFLLLLSLFVFLLLFYYYFYLCSFFIFF